MAISPDYSIFDERTPEPGVRAQRDLHAVRYIGRFGIVSLENVMVELGCGRTAAYRRVARLIEGGLLERLDLVTDQPSVLRATKDGLRYAGLGLSVAQVSPGAVRHWLLCTQEAQILANYLDDKGWEHRILSQREIPFAERIEGKPIGRAQIKRGRGERGPRWHNPDLLAFFKGDKGKWKRCAIEVELNPKTPARLREIMAAWRYSHSWIDEVIYLCAPGQTFRAISRAVEKAAIGKFTSVREIADW